MATDKPNVLLIMADDIGWFDVGAYHRGIMGTKTPNIDRIAAEGALLTDAYAQASCTAGRAAFITGQIPMRTGMTTVGLPGAEQGLQPEDPTLAELIKPRGLLAPPQIGKNHLGDRNEFLPTVHGFDEFYGNLYHLNAEEEPEQPDYPKDLPIFQQLFMPRGVLECQATDVDDPTEDPRFGPVGKQTITRHRPADPQADGDDRGRPAGALPRLHRPRPRRPSSRSCCGTTRPACTCGPVSRSGGRTRPASGVYADGMQELDWVVGELLNKLDELGIADNTIVVFTSDNGAEKFTWPDGGTSPFRGEKGLGWEGGFRAPFADPLARHDPRPDRFSTASSRWRTSCRRSWPRPACTDVKEQLLEGYQAGEKTLPRAPGRVQPAALPRPERSRSLRVTSSSTTASTTCSRCATTTGRCTS